MISSDFMNSGLFGGAFDPPHRGHFTIARILLEKNLVDQVWFVPVGQDPFDKQLKANGHRQKMLELGITSLSQELQSRLRVEDFELNKNGKSYSLETLDYLRDKYPEHTLTWIIGSDQLLNFHKWKNFHQILDTYGVWVYKRKGFELEPWYEGMQLIDGEEVEISSTQVRQAIKDQTGTEDLLFSKINEYIEANNLYQSGR